MIEAILFDLDGTLLDTGPDMAAALNGVLVENAREALDYRQIRPQVSHGARGLVRLGFGVDEIDPEYPVLRQRFLDLYAANLCRDTEVFPGMDTVLGFLEARSLPWGVVTNKPAYLTEPLLEQLGLAARAACIVCGDTLPQRKPDPAPLLHACRLIGAQPTSALYVGDAERDIVAGQAAGMATLAASFGYVDDVEGLRHWGAQAIVARPDDIIDWIEAHA